MRERKFEAKEKNICVRLTSGVTGLFKPLSREEEWKKTKDELKQHIEAIYKEIDAFSEKPDIHDALMAAYVNNEGLHCMDALQNEINHLHKQYRLTVGSCECCCEHCGELACQCCTIFFAMIILTSITMALTGKQPMVGSSNLFNLQEVDYEDPRHGKSPYSSLAKAVHKYFTWHSELPKYFTFELMDATNLQMVCESIKKECLDNQALRRIVNAP